GPGGFGGPGGGGPPGGPGGPGGGFGGRGGPGGPGGPGGGGARRGFDPARMQNFNPFNPDKSSPMYQRQNDRNTRVFAFLQARGAGKEAKLDLPRGGFGGRGGPGGPGGRGGRGPRGPGRPGARRDGVTWVRGDG